MNDSIARAGFYNVLGKPVAHHTYVILERAGVPWAFPCFGGIALREGYRGASGVVYPADLWTPYMIGSQNVGPGMPASLYMALGMAQFTTTPRTDWRVEDWERYWDAAPIVEEGIACHAGLLYAINGVCHQACNRILWSSRRGAFTECPVNWPPSFSASYWVYGYYGKLTEGDAVALAQELVRRLDAGASVGGHASAVARASATPLGDVVEQIVGSRGGALLAPVSRDERRPELVAMLAAAPEGRAAASAPTTIQGVADLDQRFGALKADLDRQLLRGELTNDAYAQVLNDAFRLMVEELRDALPAATHQQLFGEVGPGYELVSPSLMPASYEPFGEQLGI